jgi:hypothetical protein
MRRDSLHAIEPLEPRRLLAVGTLSEQIIVDQFGWRPADKKIALFADPVTGQNAPIAYSPGATFQVRHAVTDVVAFTGNTTPWRSGATHPDSGDRVWHGDFSNLTSPGEYYLYDPANDLRSYNFVISPDVYADVLQTSVRTFYYQRVGTAIPQQFGGNWNHPLAHAKDTVARLWQNGAPVPGTQRDVSGGWYDAGDYNKYVPFTTGTLWNLLTAYEWNPASFSDRTNIPESNNGTPDLLDEIRWELDWLRKMQYPNGSVINRVSNQSYAHGNADPSTDTQDRFYTAATTWATASFAASLAHASRAFQPFDPSYAATLLAAAQNAWSYLQSQPTMLPASGSDGGGSGGGAGNLASVGAGSTPSGDLRLRILASAELYKTTGSATYKSYFESNYKNPAAADNGFHPLLDGTPRFDASLAQDLNHAYVTYATTPGASAAVVDEIKSAVRNVNQSWLAYGEYLDREDPYLGFMWSGHYTWGSNQLKAEWAKLILFAYKLNVTPANNPGYLDAASEYLHYFHGRNPLSYTYLSNMGPKGANLGADKSPLEIYHSWFDDGSAKYDGAASLFGPAPGFLTGGPNQFYSGTLAPPKSQPPMKAFRDFNTAGHPSWEITEPSIYNQAAYSLLASFFAGAPTPSFLRVDGGAAFTLTGPPGAQTLTLSGGSATLTAAAWDSLPNLSLSLTNGAKLTLQSPQRFSSLSITDSATLDLASNSLILDNPSAPDAHPGLLTIRQHLLNNRLTSSTPDPTNTHSLAYLDTGSHLLIELTLTGDANLDGILNADDFALLDRGRPRNGSLWQQGDFNYDGTITDADTSLLAATYAATTASSPTAPPASLAPPAIPTSTTTPPPTTPVNRNPTKLLPPNTYALSKLRHAAPAPSKPKPHTARRSVSSTQFPAGSFSTMLSVPTCIPFCLTYSISRSTSFFPASSSDRTSTPIARKSSRSSTDSFISKINRKFSAQNASPSCPPSRSNPHNPT